MAIQNSDLVLDITAISARLLGAKEIAPRARTVAQVIAGFLPASAINIYLLSNTSGERCWNVRATVGEAEPDEAVPLESGSLGLLATNPKQALFVGKALVRDHYAHLNVRKTLHSLAYLPLFFNDELIGAIEILNFEEPLSGAHLELLQPLSEVAGPALYAAQEYELERNNSLASITRISQFYDIEKVFSSTLEMDQLLPIIGSKMCETLECEGVNIWMVQGDGSLLLMHQAGGDPTTHRGMTQAAGQGIAGDVSDTGEALLITDPEDERLVRRNLALEEEGVTSILVGPLLDQGSLVGVVEAVNRVDGEPFDEDDLFVLTSLSETASIALHNASLLMAERKVEILEMLVTISHEITSTLDLDRVLQAVVNGPAGVIPYERAAIALEQRGRMQLRALSGATEFDPQDPKIVALSQILQWASLLKEPMQISQRGEEIVADREETRAKFHAYFAQTGMRCFHAVPLADEEGRVGVLSFESSDPDFLNAAHAEMIKVLASQATVALRNASLYKEVPFIGVLQPLIDRKQRFLALEKHRRIAWAIGAGVIVLFLALFPLPLRIEGPATVVPRHAARIGAEVEGVVKEVDVKEGDRVRRGAVVGTLEDWDYRSALAADQAKRETALNLMDRALNANDGTEAGIQQAQVAYWTAEVALAKERLDRTVLRSPIDGVIATPHMENVIGHKLKFGETFADVVDNSEALVDVAVDQVDVGLVAPGQKVRIKLDSFPAHTFEGQVAVISPLGRLEGDSRTFFARVTVPNPEARLRAGMQGRGKVSTGWRPAGEVFFRQPVTWIWSILWQWFGW